MEEDKELLLKMLEIDQSRISSLDSTRFIVKGWSLTLVSALVGLTFDSSGNNRSPVFLWVGLAATLIFLLIDLSYRKVQLGHTCRSDYILELLLTKHRKEQEVEHINLLLPIKTNNQQTQNSVKFIYQGFASTIKELLTTKEPKRVLHYSPKNVGLRCRGILGLALVMKSGCLDY